ncbi:hypothetical protein [Streptomyces albipurpureus]|uniref:Uncharacterized protein n=1 Tax=Streptomyces albipurpureus TaxID=2897419 RepID=A0ABT0UYD6_9ACTN|nr:hypothetical protein [Streptomyces sp. CWNU-1]MCM2393437.1 hypothetical protein [Streptomyces sp. CWNU-1]
MPSQLSSPDVLHRCFGPYVHVTEQTAPPNAPRHRMCPGVGQGNPVEGATAAVNSFYVLASVSGQLETFPDRG